MDPSWNRYGWDRGFSVPSWGSSPQLSRISSFFPAEHLKIHGEFRKKIFFSQLLTSITLRVVWMVLSGWTPSKKKVKVHIVPGGFLKTNPKPTQTPWFCLGERTDLSAFGTTHFKSGSRKHFGSSKNVPPSFRGHNLEVHLLKKCP